MSLKKLKPGRRIFEVYAIPGRGKFPRNQAWIEEYEVVRGPAYRHYGNWAYYYIRVKDVRNGLIRDCSLEDANVVHNHYNCHRIFFNRESAERYMNNPNLWHPKAISRERFQWDHWHKWSVMRAIDQGVVHGLGLIPVGGIAVWH